MLTINRALNEHLWNYGTWAETWEPEEASQAKIWGENILRIQQVAESLKQEQSDLLKEKRKMCFRILVLFILWEYVWKDYTWHSNEG